MPSLIASVINVTLGFFVFYQGPERKANRVFSLLMAAFAIWNFGEWVMMSSASASFALLWGKIEWVGVSFLGCIYLHLAFSFPRERRILENSFAYLLIYLPGFIFLYFNLATDWLIKGMQATRWASHYLTYGWLFNIYSVYFEVALLIGLYLFYQIWRASPESSQGKQARWMFVATAIPIVGGSLTNVILPAMGFYVFPIASSLTITTSALIAYAMLRYKEMFLTPTVVADDIIATMPSSLIICDPRGKILAVNKASLALLGYQEKELVGEMVDKLSSKVVKGFPMKEMKEKGDIENYELKYLTKTGKAIPISFSGSVINDKRGELIGFVGIARDMRELKKLQDKVVQSEKLAAVGQMAAVVGHELRNPLNGIKMSTYYLNEKLGKEGSKYSRIIGNIEKEISQASSVITNILEFSNSPKLFLEPTDLNALVNEAVVSALEKGLLKNTEVVKNLDMAIPKILLDGGRFNQALHNLILNASQAMLDGGKLTLQTSNSGRKVEIKVTDTGSGVAPAKLAKIFEPFYTEKSRGIGLGLPIVKEIVDQHKGKIFAKSQLNRGSTFIIELPLTKGGK